VPYVANSCGGEISNKTFFKLQSPGYPVGYEANMSCSWLVHSPSGGKVYFRFIDINLQFSSSQCSGNHVILYDGAHAISQIIYEPVCDMGANRLYGKEKPFSSTGRLLVE